ncbi:Phage tail tape measure protein, family, core region protein [human gut metagenome]|uniref:Phage tail tape measure protein, family, core region protein n=1 Tax=human gut metagenome TaxID=408170 RepID=W1YA50_9ZZZZ
MSMAGWSAKESIAGLPSVLRLAQIGCTDLGTASDIVTDVITAMGMQATDCGDMADMFTAAITSSNTNVEMLGNTMSYVAPIAGSLGVEFEDLALAAGLLADSGIKASKSGTSLRTLLSNLAAPTDAATKTMEKYGISMVETEAGTVDLDKTMQSLRKSLKDLPLKEQTAAAKDLFGKTGMAGGLTIINASEEHYNSLKQAIEGSTESMTYWREELEKAGASDKKIDKKLEHLHSVFQKTKDMADGLNISSSDLTFTISLFNENDKVSTKNVEDLFQMMSKLSNASKDQQKILQENGIQISKNDDDTLNYNESLRNIVDTLRGKTKQERENILSSLGLADAINEVNELCAISPSRFDEVAKGIERTQSAAEKAQDIIDNSLVGAAKSMGSAISGLGLILMGQASPALSEFCRWIANMSNELANNNIGKAFDTMKQGFSNALSFIKGLNISEAIQTAFNGINTFITTKGAFSGLLDIGKEAIHQVCQGIINSKDSIRESISSAIKQIAGFVKDVSPQIGQAGKVILDALRDGIKNNSDEIYDALDAVASAMNSWVQGGEQIKSLTGSFADIFIDSLIENFQSRTVGRATELWNAATSWLTNSKPDFSKGITNLINGFFNSTPDMKKTLSLTGLISKIANWFTGESYAAEKTGNEKELKTNSKDSKNSNKINSKLSSMDANEIKALQTQLTALQTTAQSVSSSISQAFTSLQNNLRTSLVGCANITRNQFVNIANITRNQFLSVSNVIRNQITNSRNVVTSQMISMKNVISTQISEARNKLTSQMISIRNVSRTQITQARNTVTSQMISMKNVISTQSREARNNFTRQMISMKNVARTQSTQIGQQMANGVTKGLQSGTGRAVSAARNLVNQVNAEMRKTAKINSPSKVTTQYGEYMDEGLINGLKNKSKDIVEVAKGITTEMQNAMKAAVQLETSKFALEAKANSSINIIGQVKDTTSKKINDLIDTLQDTKDRPIHVEANMDKTKVVNIIAKPVDEKNKRDKKRLNRLEGITT